MPIKPRTKKPTLSQFGDYLAGLHQRVKRWKKKSFSFSTWVCQTKACAIGWGIIEKQLPGMRFNTYNDPSYRGVRNLRAVAKYFKINYADAEHLFVDEWFFYRENSYVTALNVSKAIKKFLKERKVK